MEVNAPLIMTLTGCMLIQLLVASLLITRRHITLWGVTKLLTCELLGACLLIAAVRMLRRSAEPGLSNPITQRQQDRR